MKYISARKFRTHLGVSQPTLNNWLTAGRVIGARKDSSGIWLIPSNAKHPILLPRGRPTNAVRRVIRTGRRGRPASIVIPRKAKPDSFAMLSKPR